MKRTKPCEYCKRRRRKCERPADRNSCLRCTRLSLECTYDITTSANTSVDSSSGDLMTSANNEDMAEVDGRHELHDLTHYVEELERELQNLQLQLDQHRQHNKSAQKLMIPKSTTTMDSLPIPKDWNLTIINGHLRLETGINTLSDLLQYQQSQSATTSHIRYLSPFSNTTPFHFRLEQESMLSKAVHLLTKHGVFNESFENLNDASSSQGAGNNAHWGHQHRHHNDLGSPNSLLPVSFCNHTSQRPLILPATLFATTSHCPELMVDILVKQYFKCYNLPLPMLHEPTYMDQYTKSTFHTHSSTHGLAMSSSISSESAFSTSPSSSSEYTPSSSSSSSSTINSVMSQYSPITLAICCFMSVSYCQHLPLTVYQKREYGEYFYLACREQIDELYDDSSPHKQLQVLISINFLFKFMCLTLRLKDGRKLATIGYLTSLELSKHAASSNTTFDQVEKGLTSRHTILAAIIFGLTEFVCAQRMEDIMPNKIQLDALPGEPDVTVAMLHLFECLFSLVLDHRCIVMVHQMRRVIIGQVGQISLEAVVQFDNLCMEWWKKVPDHWRYYENPYNTSVKHVIEQCENEQTLVLHSFLLTLTLGVHSILLHPQNVQEHVSELIQKRAMMVTLNCCELLLIVADRLRVISNHCGYYCDYLLRVFDSLHSLLVYARNSENGLNMDTIIKYISRCLEEIDAVVTLGFQQPLPSSFFPGNDIHSSIYASYPLPGNVLVFDIVSSSAKSLGVDMP